MHDKYTLDLKNAINQNTLFVVDVSAQRYRTKKAGRGQGSGKQDN